MKELSAPFPAIAYRREKKSGRNHHVSLQAGRTFSLIRKWGKQRPDRGRSQDLKLALSLHPLHPALDSGAVLSSIMQHYSLPALIAAGFRVKKFSFEIIMPTSVHPLAHQVYANASERSDVDGWVFVPIYSECWACSPFNEEFNLLD